MAEGRITRVDLEVATQSDDPEGRITRVDLEVAQESPPAQVRVSRVNAEVLAQVEHAQINVSRVNAEVLVVDDPPTDPGTFVGSTEGGAGRFVPSYIRAYVKKVTIPAGAVLARIEAFGTTGTGGTPGFRVALWEDDEDAPGLLIAASQPLASSTTYAANARWFGAAIGRWFENETDVWIGVQFFNDSTVRFGYVEGGGTDRYIQAGGGWLGESGAMGVTVSSETDDDYSIRGLVVT